MGKLYFYCCNDDCQRFGKKTCHVPLLELGQELEGKKLCKDCVGAGFLLQKGILVLRRKKGGDK